MSKAMFVILNMEKKNTSPIVSFEDSLDKAIQYTEGLDVEDENNIWIEHWEDGFSKRLLKRNKETGDYESHFDDSYIPDDSEDTLDTEAMYDK